MRLLKYFLVVYFEFKWKVKQTPCNFFQPLGSSSTEPLCFELFPAPEGMGRSHFEQAMQNWEKEQRTTR